MPPAIAGIVLAAALAGGGAFLAGASVALAIGIFVANIAIGLLSYMLQPKPSSPNLASFSVQAQDRLQQVRQPISARRLIYGEVRVSGPLVFIETTNANKYLHLVIVLGDGPIQAINTIWLDEDPIHNESIDGSGDVISGKYLGKVRVKKHLGTVAQTADADLVSAITRYTTARRGQGVAYIYVRLEYDRDLFPAAIPNHSAYVKGRLVYDPRDASTAWNPNVVLGARDYLTRTRLLGGLGTATTELNDTINGASANVCDEIVATKTITLTVTAFDDTNDTISLAGEILELQTGDRVELSESGGTLPAEFATGTSYYVIMVNEAASLDADEAVLIPVKIQLATSYDNAILGTAIDFTDAGTATSTVFKTGEPRYTANGVVVVDRAPFAILKDFELSMAGRIVNAGGEWRMIAGAYTAPAVHFTLTHARSTIKKRTKHPRRARFNGIHGIFVSPLSRWQPTDYPAVRSTTFKAEDDGEELLRNVDLPMTTRGSMAQRIAWIELKRHRKQVSVDFPAKIHGIQVQAGSTCTLTAANLNFASTVFEVAEWSMSVQDQGGGPAIVTDLSLREISSDVFTFTYSTDEQLLQAPVRVSLLNPFVVPVPTAFIVTTETIDNAAGSSVDRIRLFWASPLDQFVTSGGQIEIAWRLKNKTMDEWGMLDDVALWDSGDLNWEPSRFVDGAERTADIMGVKRLRVYDIRIRSVNNVGRPSAWVTITDYTIGSAAVGVTAVVDYGSVAVVPDVLADWGGVAEAASGSQPDYGSVA